MEIEIEDEDVQGGLPGRIGVGWSFALRSAAVFFLVGLVAHSVVVSVIAADFRDALDFHGEYVSRVVIGPMLASPDALTHAELSARITERVELDAQVTGLQVIRDGQVVAADDAVLVGEPIDGMPIPDDGLVATTVLLDGSAAGTSVRVVQDWGPSRGAAQALTRTVDVIVGVGLLALWMVVLPMVIGLGRRLRGRTAALERQRGELRRLLATEQEAVQQLEAVGRLRESFLSAVSHELRTPLTVVNGVLLTLAEHGEQIEQELRDDLLSRARRNATKLGELLSGLLDLNRLKQNSGAVQREAVDIAAAVSEVAAQLPPFRLDLDLDVETVVGDALEIERILANLIGNARRHAPGDEPLQIRTRRIVGEVELVVADRGPGVPDALKQVIFDPFEQGDIQDKHAPGTGIGLSLVSRFAENHGGHTWVTDRPGGGAQFHVRIPQPASADAEVQEAAGDRETSASLLPTA